LRGARIHGLTKRTERVRTYHGMTRHGIAAPIGYYPFSQRARRVLGGDSRAYGDRVRSGVVRARAAPPRLGYGTWNRSRSNGPSSSVLAGYSEGTRGVLMGPCVERSAQGRGTGRAAHSQSGRTELEHARGYCQRYRVPHSAGPLAGAFAGVHRGHVRRGDAHGGGRGPCAVLAHTASRSALSEYARATAWHGTALRRR
jgi:hypothetical protein